VTELRLTLERLLRWPGRDALSMALQVPLRNPGRSALTTLGLAIGVGAFIAMVSFGRGARMSVVSQFEILGSNIVRIKPAYGKVNDPPKPLTLIDVAALERESTTLEHVIPYAATTGNVTAGRERVRTGVHGTTPEYVTVRGWKFAAGGLFTQDDVRRRAKVCVLGAATASTLFGTGDPLGQAITVEGKLPCRVVGVLAQIGATISGSDMDSNLLMPLGTFEAHFGLPNGLSVIEARPKSPALLEAAKVEVRLILRRSHQRGSNQSSDVTVGSPDDITRVADRVGGILTGLLAGIAAVSLLVGGIGIMNIQLVSVAERTHEIGIRAAIGATPRQIEKQFLSEAVVLAALGTAAGVALGLLVSTLVARQMHWPHATGIDIVLGSAAFGLAVGTLFGYLPARRAAQLDPVEALRRE
jgi:putative ABC transport system permease protein